MRHKILFLSIIYILMANLALAATNDWKRYPYQASGSEIVFPKDEGAHPGIPNMEWWYSVMHLKGQSSGDHYSVLVTHFNNHIRFFTVTNLDKGTHTSGTTMGVLRSQKGKLNIAHLTKYGKDIFRSKTDGKGRLIPFEYEIKTHHDQMQLNVTLNSQKRPLMVTGDGLVTVGTSGYSYYYSLTRLQVEGQLSYLGTTEQVKGDGWMDHQWGPFIISPFEIGRAFETYEWFCVQLDNGQELMISNIFDREYHLPMTEEYGGIELVRPDGKSMHLYERDFKRTGYWQDPVSKNYMSMGWELDVPQWNLHLKLQPDFLDQMVRLPAKGSFWEGSISVTGLVDNRPVKGKAFGELIHRYQKPELTLAPIKTTLRKDENLKIQWRVKNPDDGNPLHYNVYLVHNGLEVAIARNLLDNTFEAKIDTILTSPNGAKIKIKVQASSVDGKLEDSVLSSELNVLP